MTQAVKSELMLALEQIEREKGVKKDEVLKMIEGALVSALRKHIGKLANIEAVIDPETAGIKAFVVKKVVAAVTQPELEISMDELKRLKIKAELEQELRFPIDAEDFARIAAQTAKQVLVQKIREIERDNLYEEYKPREGEVVTGSVHRFMDRNLIVDLGKTEAILPVREQIRKERYNNGDRVKAIILKVDKAQRGPQVLLSRASPLFLKRLFETEVPEVAERTVEVVNIVRDAGFRAKVVVRSNNAKVDPIGACVGIRGSRIRSIMTELAGERIDLIAYSDDPRQFLINALSPAKVSSVRVLDKDAKQAEVIVPDDQLSLAIGKDGHNVRLASRLTGWQLEVKSEAQKGEEAKKRAENLTADLTQLEGIGPKTAEVLIKGGMADIAKLAACRPEDLTTLQGIGEKTAAKIVESAKKYIEERRGQTAPAEGPSPASAVSESEVPAVPETAADLPEAVPASEEGVPHEGAAREEGRGEEGKEGAGQGGEGAGQEG